MVIFVLSDHLNVSAGLNVHDLFGGEGRYQFTTPVVSFAGVKDDCFLDLVTGFNRTAVICNRIVMFLAEEYRISNLSLI